jgi:tRNA (guanine37-N1)-methyltransferase
MLKLKLLFYHFMKIDILTLFPDMFRGPFDESIIKRAQDKNKVEIDIHNLRRWATDKHKTVDDKPFGGGAGMVLKVDVMDKAITSLKKGDPNTIVILLDAAGIKFTQKDANLLSERKHIVLVAGHYEGVDFRIRERLVDEVYSIGDYVLTGGELPAMVVTDAIVRLLPGVLEKSEATEFESFSSFTTDNLQKTTLLEYPQYTRPEVYKGWSVPKILLSGNHKEIKNWRDKQAFIRTKKVRPDLLKK